MAGKPQIEWPDDDTLVAQIAEAGNPTEYSRRTGNYAVWGIEPIYGHVLNGDLDATAEYDVLLRTLAGVNIAWRALHS